jgi:hypothetical protein
VLFAALFAPWPGFGVKTYVGFLNQPRVQVLCGNSTPPGLADS